MKFRDLVIQEYVNYFGTNEALENYRSSLSENRRVLAFPITTIVEAVKPHVFLFADIYTGTPLPLRGVSGIGWGVNTSQKAYAWNPNWHGLYVCDPKDSSKLFDEQSIEVFSKQDEADDAKSWVMDKEMRDWILSFSFYAKDLGLPERWKERL